MSAGTVNLDKFMDRLRKRTKSETEFHQAVEEVMTDLVPVVNDNDAYRDAAILERLTEPDRIISFRVVWVDDKGKVHVNRGYRVQFNSAIGPYKGGLRFHPTVTPSVLKFLGFEQTLKNALTGLPMGGGKGGSDFNPRGRSDAEVMRFCQSFMLELYRHINPEVDVPAGDINVGAREIGYLFGAYKRITNSFAGALTGKGLSYGGSALRTEATGYGLMYFVENVLKAKDKTVEGQTVAISGAGNVALHAAEKAQQMGARVVTLSNSRGCLSRSEGFSADEIAWLKQYRGEHDNVLKTFAEDFSGDWHEDSKPWEARCDVALPCATQNELGGDDAKTLVKNACALVAEGANMPVTAEAKKVFAKSSVILAPGKAANAGGVAVSGLEISQNRVRQSRSRDDIDRNLKRIMQTIHDQCVEAGRDGDGNVDYARGANIAGFKKVADAMLAQGIG